jgi:tetratricopeptide (TPR) repeat protein
MLIQLQLYKKIFLTIILISLFLSCTSEKYHFYLGTKNDKKLLQLFTLLDEADSKEEPQMEVHYTIMNRIISEYKAAGESDKMNLFLTDYISTHKNDPYMAYYLLTIAENHKSKNSRVVAETYFRRILYNYPDLIIKGQSIHNIILEELAFNSDNYEERVYAFEELLARFPGEIEKGQIYYYLGKSYAELGFWDEAFTAYENFLKSPDTEIAGDPNARLNLTDLLRFHRSDKSWTRTDLNQLVINIRSAIYQRSGSKLKRYKADKFFTMSWSQDETDMFTHTNLDVASFLNPGVQVKRDLDPMSNESEAFLRSWGWSYRIRTWYLYFKKIDYPADPEINGRWEWAGIYFGDTF